MNRHYTPQDVEERIRDQFPAVLITLVSVLIGLVLADLVAEARARMVFWPLSLDALRTWFQFATNGLSALVAWIVYSHIGISRRRIPSFADALIAFSVPLGLLFGTSVVGIPQAWAWFYFASGFLFVSLATTIWLLRIILTEEEELAGFKRFMRPMGYLSVFAMGIPFYAAAGWADQHHLLSPLLEVLCVASGPPSALLACHLFLRDWRIAIGAPRAAGT
jgi:hypothetical protein